MVGKLVLLMLIKMLEKIFHQQLTHQLIIEGEFVFAEGEFFAPGHVTHFVHNGLVYINTVGCVHSAAKITADLSSVVYAISKIFEKWRI